MIFSIQQSVDYVLNEAKPQKLRAIEMFTLLVALHEGKATSKVSARGTDHLSNSLLVEIPTQTIRAARLLSALKFLDSMEQQQRKTPTIRAMIDVPDYETILDNVVFTNGSWNKLRFYEGLRELEGEIHVSKRQARQVAKIIEFSFRFEFNPDKRKHIGGVTMATDIVTKVPYFKVKVKDSQLEAMWSRLQGAAPFFYLIYVQRFPFYLRKIAGKKLGERLLAMIDDQKRLQEFFAQYNVLVEQLRQRGYKYTALNLPPLKSFVALQPSPFKTGNKEERAVLDEIESYRR